MALTVGVATVLDSREVIIAVTGLRKALALSKAIGMYFYFLAVIYCTDSCVNLGRGGSQPSGGFIRYWRLSPSHYHFTSQWTLSALQLHPWALIVVDEDATSGEIKMVLVYRFDLT